ncbi:MAG TPA: xanthine dehydrogenase family protein subunit M [Actinomycetes bacterium]|nr:xanthine dehydrogenase family protein subunit M [Actinomycetes bacterium]
MKPAPFDYAAPASLDEVVATLAEHGDDAKVLAGGQSLVPLLAFRLAAPSVLVDLNGVAGLEHLRLEGDRLVVGALVRQRTIERLPGLRRRCAMLAEGVAQIGHVAIRNRGTVGGSLAHADPAAEWPALALALDGECEVLGPRGRRIVPAEALFVSYLTTSLEPDELITELRLTLPGGKVGSTFVELARRHGDFAIAGVGAMLGLAEDGSVGRSRLVLIGVGERAVRAHRAEALLVGEKPSDELLDEAAAAVDEAIAPGSDLHGSAEYRRQVATVLTRRALAVARARANGKEIGPDGQA